MEPRHAANIPTMRPAGPEWNHTEVCPAAFNACRLPAITG
jgi:hypothetical protein